MQIDFGNGRLNGTVTASLDEGRRQIRFECNGDFDQIIDEIGNTPLPPYIKRKISAELRLEVTAVPHGWGASVEPASCALAPGESGPATLTVSPPPNARPDRYAVDVTARASGASDTATVTVEVTRGRP